MKYKHVQRIFQQTLFAGMLLLFVSPLLANAQVPDPAGTNYGLDEFSTVSIGQSSDVKIVIADIINIVLGFLGIIAVVIIIYAGFKWMTAGGNDDQVGEARKMLVQAVVGLVIIFAAWAIASFAIEQLRLATEV